MLIAYYFSWYTGHPAPEQCEGWRFNWVSSNGNDFNRDYHVTFSEEELATGKVDHNFDLGAFPSANRHHDRYDTGLRTSEQEYSRGRYGVCKRFGVAVGDRAGEPCPSFPSSKHNR